MEIRDFFTQKVIDNNVTISALKDAYSDNDQEQIRTLLGLTDQEVADLSNELSSLRVTIINSDPDFYNNSSNYCSGCQSQEQIDYFFSNYYSLTSSDLPIPIGSVQWPQYTACLIICTTTGPFIYWPCAYLCYDTYTSKKIDYELFIVSFNSCGFIFPSNHG